MLGPLYFQQICTKLHRHIIVQDKSYSRDWLVRGRIRIELKNAEGKPLNPEIPTSKSQLPLPLSVLCPCDIYWSQEAAELMQIALLICRL